MTSSNTKIRLLAIATLLLAATSWAQTCPPAAEKIAEAYGLDSFEQIDAVRSTFNIDFPGLKISQSWIWEPKADRVTYEGKDKAGNPVKITYVRSQLSSQPDNVKNEIDPSFNNNQYWLFLPFHACWDTAAKVEDSGMHKLPTGGGSARRVVMTYPPEGGGYTPGDTWEMYVGPDPATSLAPGPYECFALDSDPNSASLNRMVPIAGIWLLETLIDMKGQLN